MKPPGGLAAVALAATGLLMPLSAFADEPLFGYVYTTDLLPRGKFELAQWATWRTGHSLGQFDVLEGRTEFEYGATDRLQLSAYLNYEWARAAHDNVIDGTTLPPGTLANLDVGPAERLNTTRFTGVSVEGIYRIWSPYTNPVGIAIDADISPDENLVLMRIVLSVIRINVGIADVNRYIFPGGGKAVLVVSLAGGRYLHGLILGRLECRFIAPGRKQQKYKQREQLRHGGRRTYCRQQVLES